MSLLSIQNVTKQYANHRALDEVSIEIPEQSIFGLLGPNGAGKTSLIRIITQITAADSGVIYFNGQALKADHVRQMGYLPEERGLYKKMEVGEQLLYFARLKGLHRAEAVKRIKAWGEKFEVNTWWKKKVQELSKGMQQKIQFIATVLHEPKFIILDEPFSGFDPVNTNLIKQEILELRNQGATILFSTHRMESVEELCDHIALINQSKKVLDGAVKEVKDTYRSNTFEVTYKGTGLQLQAPFDLQSEQTVDNESQLQKATISIAEGHTTNELLSHLINQQLSIQHFEEKIPSINDIFIQLVNQPSQAN